MSYVVFARKWRPLTFDDVVGQEHITGTLKKAIEKDRVAHAYIFTGTRGVGKTTTARILSRALNCEKGPTPTPCGLCDTCKSIISGSNFDVIEIDGASNNSVDDIRELRENINYSSMGGKYRIYVIDEVHMLSKSAFNALLKTLEEPPDKVIFIFATTEPQKIPATIQSRCQRYDFRRISTEQITAQLARICTEEHIGFDPQALTLIGRKAEGSMRDALSLLDQVYSYCPDAIGEKDVRAVLGLVDAEVYGSIMNAVKAGDPAPVLQIVQDILYGGFDLQEFLGGFEEYLRTLLFSSIKGVLDNPRIDLQGADVAAAREHAAGLSEKTLLRMAEIVRKTEHDLKWSAFPRFLVELSLLKLVYLDSTVSVEQMLELFEQHEAQKPGAAMPPRPDSHASAAGAGELKKKNDPAPPLTGAGEEFDSAPTAIDDGEITPESAGAPAAGAAGALEHWPRCLETLRREQPMLGHFLAVATVEGHSDHGLHVRFPQSCRVQYAEASEKKNRSEIERVLRQTAGAPVEVRITLDGEAGGPHAAKNERGAPPFAGGAEREPIIKSILTIFDGDLIH